MITMSRLYPMASIVEMEINFAELEDVNFRK